MFRHLTLMLPLAVMAISGCSTAGKSEAPARSADSTKMKSLADYQAAAARFNNVLRLPEFETTPAALTAVASQTMTNANAALDRIGQLTPTEVTFANTVGALDDIAAQVGGVMGRLYLIKETSPALAMRDTATAEVKCLQEWAVGLDYREDVYRAVKAYADRQPALTGEDQKLLAETLRDYRRAGLALPKAQRDEVERLRKQLTQVGTDFSSNVTKSEKALKFTRAELDGVPASLLEAPGVKTGNDEYTIKLNVTWQYLAVAENARREDIRRRVVTEQHRLTMAENTPLIKQILILRDQIAQKLGYACWADFVIEVKMAGNARTAIEFSEKLRDGLQPKFAAELAEFRRLKVAETGQPDAEIHLWDWRYYANELKKQKYNVDAEQLRVFFPMERVLDGMFAIYQRIFGLKFERIEPPFKWVEDLQLWVVSDRQTGEPLGCFYLDLFPREGKFNHFAMFPIIDGQQLADGRYQRPVCALVCNFPPPTADKPSLLDHEDVTTLFHEFGHAMHGLLTRARFIRFAGTSVPGDFVEAPSQMLEAWVWDKQVLDSFAADYRDPTRKIPAEILDQLQAAKYAVYATFYRRQLSFGLMDLMLHTHKNETNVAAVVPFVNDILSRTFLPVPEDSFLLAHFGHFNGYDGGYYGYAWADAIAADMATVFESAPERYFDESAGRRLRDEIYAVGNSRDANESIRKFLGRERSLEPFLKKIGAQAK